MSTEDGVEVEAGENGAVEISVEKIAAEIAELELSEEELKKEEEPYIDVSLLNGLELAMSEDEQIEMTRLMTSGNPIDVARACRTMRYLGNLLRHGVLPHSRDKKHLNVINEMQESTYSKRTRLRKLRLELRKGNTEAGKEYKATRHAAIDSAEFVSMHPLPDHKPKYVEIDTFDPFAKVGLGIVFKQPLEFVNDKWDGTVEAGFSHITVSGGSVEKQRVRNAGTVHILESSGKTYKYKLEDMPTRRVVVSSVAKDARKWGVRVGDIVTHIFDYQLKDVSGMSAKEVMELIKSIHDRGADSLNIVFNATPATCEILRLRKIAGDRVLENS